MLLFERYFKKSRTNYDQIRPNCHIVLKDLANSDFLRGRQKTKTIFLGKGLSAVNLSCHSATFVTTLRQKIVTAAFCAKCGSAIEFSKAKESPLF